MASRWQKRTPGAFISAGEHGRERAIGRIAGGQRRLITSPQLLGLGFSRTGVQKRVESNRLFPLQHGVYATHPPPFSREQRWLGAVLACGPGALLSHLPAAGHQNLLSDEPHLGIHVMTSSGRGRSRDGIVVHRSAVDPRDARRVRGIPCTSADRILVDLAPATGEPELEAMMIAAESLGILKRHRLAELASERRGRPGAHKILRLLQLEPALIRSDLELLFQPLWREAGVERPQMNLPISVEGASRTLTVDFAWPALRLIVEADSQRFHGDWASASNDRLRDQLLGIEGWIVHRFVRRMVRNDLAGSAERLRRLVEVRRRQIASAPPTRAARPRRSPPRGRRPSR